METAEDFAKFRVMQDCFRQKVTKAVGYEAALAHVEYSLKSVEEMAVNLKISGFSDNLFKFAKEYIKILVDSAVKDGFVKNNVRHSIEKIRSEYANNNNEVDDKAGHNRLLMLIPHSFHDKLMEK